MSRYRIQVGWTGGWLEREVEFDGRQITAAWHDGEPHELRPEFAEAMGAVLRAHEGSGHGGTSATIEIVPVPLGGDDR